jgi:D-alanyl-D-alanine carboxypeptidase (penicillin-binding protein 5/6)
MRKHRKIINLVCCALCVFTFPVSAQSSSSPQQYPFAIESPIDEATAWVLMDFASGTIVGGENIDAHSEPASITKLMTNYVVFSKLKAGDIKLDDKVYISEKAWRMEGSRMFAEYGSRLTVEQLVKSTAIQSGNDAAVALAEFIGGTEEAFATMMNKAAAQLGMNNSSFKNATGLPAEGHYISAADIAKLSSAIIREFPQYYAWYSEKEYSHNNITQQNRNRLLWRDPSVDGLKTGHTKAAGYCLVGSAKQDGQRWIAVVLGTESEKVRADLVLRLLRQGFAEYQSVDVLDSQSGVMNAQVFKGEVDQISLKPKSPVSVVVPQGRYDDIEFDYKVSPYFEAPISLQQPMGLVSVSLDGKVLKEVPLVAMSQIAQAGLIKQLKDTIRLKWHTLIN